MARKKTIKYNPEHYLKEGVMAGVIYGKGDKKIRESKTVIKSNGKIKEVKYGPVDYYGNQTKTKTRFKPKKGYY